MKEPKMRTLTSKLVSASMMALAVASCAVGPNYAPPETPIPSEFRDDGGAAGAQSVADLAWWDLFRDPALKQLVSNALANSNSLDIAVARVEQARALLGVSRSQFYPQVGYGVAGGSQQVALPQSNGVDEFSYDSISGVLSAAWELDVWGRIRRSNEAAKANLMAQEYVYRGVMLTLVSDVALGYFRLLRLDKELAIAEESNRVYRDTANLFRVRFEAGRDSRLPVERADAAYSSSTARIADLRRQITQQENALSVLVGAYPGAIPRGRPLIDQTMPATPAGLTSDLLKRRPDVLRAEQVMIAANAEVGVAVANFFPRVGLSALVGGEEFDADDFSGSFDVWNVLGNVAGPIFDGGRLSGLYDERRAFWDESIAAYRHTILTAFQDTSDALVAQRTLADRRAAQEREVTALRHSVDFALIRYRAGRASYFEVIEAEQQLFPAQDALAQTTEAQLIATVNLYKALGGGWNLTNDQWVQPN
jgi:multidrug efflux system outer membrane protein